MLKVYRNGVVEEIPFQVVVRPNKPLLSAETCKQLGLITLAEEISVPVNNVVSEAEKYVPLTKEMVLKEYKDVFEGLGHIGEC